MSSCKSQGAASSCSTTLPAPPAAAIERAAGADPILVTDAVVEKVTQMLAEEGDSAMCLRVFVSGGGCSGLQYGFSIEDAPAENDVLVQRGVLSVVVDPMSLQYLAGAEIDFQDGLEGANFIIRNPNATSTCGCGNSFST
ncbi:MAG: iron-sulfur cluster insertion protein ErpA [Thiomonas sp.]|uniref:iron-sulfur cluster insertion protein ErpA n=1 Tax=Thiomonas sp. TaxID=2047785 RepID=UPI002A3661A2|nr:iron-sulfur cluster insertion protein ErpA [Thiomonas sp.]MDY0329773.1 iron-sulfur cluster insertion protein ErpA [Thiomonas sp.]